MAALTHDEAGNAEVVTWGCTDDGVLGRKAGSRRTMSRPHRLPAVVSGLPPGAALVSAGELHTLAIAPAAPLEKMALWVWGRVGQALLQVPTPVLGEQLSEAHWLHAYASEWYTFAVCTVPLEKKEEVE